MKYPRTAQLCREARARLALSREAFAALLWTGGRTIANWEDGDKPPNGVAERFLTAIRDGYNPETIERPQ